MILNNDQLINLKTAYIVYDSGADPGFQVRGGALKKIAEGGAKIFGVFRVKNHDFMQKKTFFPILGGGGAPDAPPPPLDPPL